MQEVAGALTAMPAAVGRSTAAVAEISTQLVDETAGSLLVQILFRNIAKTYLSSHETIRSLAGFLQDERTKQ